MSYVYNGLIMLVFRSIFDCQGGWFRFVIIASAVVEAFPHLKVYNVDVSQPVIRMVQPVGARPGADLATIAGFLNLSQDPALTIVKSKISQDVNLETLSLASPAGEEARRNFMLKDIQGLRSNTPPMERPIGAMPRPPGQQHHLEKGWALMQTPNRWLMGWISADVSNQIKPV